MNRIETALKTKVRPMTITITESEILADLRYPAQAPMPVPPKSRSSA